MIYKCITPRLTPVLSYTLLKDHHASKVTLARLVRTQRCALHIGISHPADVSHFNEIDVHGIQIDSHGIGVACRRIPKLG